MKLERTLKQHANGVPEIIANGSKAQIVYCIADAKKDIATLANALLDIINADNYEEFSIAKERAAEILK